MRERKIKTILILLKKKENCNIRILHKSIAASIAAVNFVIYPAFEIA